jgi:hypothetical protein
MSILKGIEIASKMLLAAGVIAFIITSMIYSISVIVKNLKH